MDEAASRWSRVRRLFETLVDLPQEERSSVIDAADLDSSERELVEGMLRADADEGGGPKEERRTLGRYELISLLGQGGMGEVHLASDKTLDRHVALKLLSQEHTADPRWLSRFRREARAASAVNHPSILTVYEIGEEDGTHYIATEHIEGENLRQRLGQKPLTVKEAVEIAIQVAGALAAAHKAGIVHRDVKPENVMVRRDGIVKVLDFGLAKPNAGAQVGSGITTPGTVIGTLSYLSPEQARGLEADPRSDVFGLGVVLHEMLTGRVPFRGDSPADVLVEILQAPTPELPTELEEAAPGLGEVLRKCLAKKASERFATATDLKAALDGIEPSREMVGRPSWAAAPPSGTLPAVRYAQSGEINIAFQVVGDGPIDLVFVMGWVSHLEHFWSHPSFGAFLRRLASFARVILFDKRGTGLSDRVAVGELPTLEQRMDDVRAVMDSVGSRKAVLLGVSEGGPMCSLFAATYPERTIALVMFGSYARRLRSDDYPWGPTEEERELFLEQLQREWGGPVGLDTRAPSLIDDDEFREWWAAYLRHGASPNAAVALTRMNAEVDIRKVLPTVRVPTLVMHRTGDMCLTVEEGRFLAEQIPGARFVELEGIDHLPFVGEQEEMFAALQSFLDEVPHQEEHDRVLATVVVAETIGADITPFLSELAERELGALQGRIFGREPRRIRASFDGPARAIRAASHLIEACQRANLPLRIGIHTGECDVLADGLGGVAVEIAERVAEQANRGELRLSATVRGLVAGAGMRFEPAGEVEVGFGPLDLFRLG